MSHSPVNLAILGCGAITRRHSRTLARFRGEVCCFYASRDASAAAAFAERYAGAGSFGSYEDAIAAPHIDAVLVATPPGSHLDLTLAALGDGKDVIVEKPAFSRSADFALVRAAEARSGRRVMVAENYCYKPLARVLREILASGVLGEVRFVQIDAVKRQAPMGWRADPSVMGSGALFEGGVHWIDLFANLGLTIETVHGYRPGDWQGCERSMLVVAEYEEGAIGTLAHSWEVPSPLRGLRVSHIYGTRGSVSFESNGLFAMVTGPRPRLILPGLRDISGAAAEYLNYHMYRAMLGHASIGRVMSNRGSRAVSALFARRPFLAVWICAWSPLPDWAARVLASHARYSIRRYLAAVLAGRIPKFWFLAAVGMHWAPSGVTIMAIVVGSVVVTLGGVLFHRSEGRSQHAAGRPAVPIVAGMGLDTLPPAP